MLKKSTFISLNLLLAASLYGQTTINFTNAEGYVDGPLDNNANWTGGYNDFDVVDAAGAGAVRYSSADNNYIATILTGNPIGDSSSIIKISVDFSFTRGVETTGVDNQGLLRIGLTTNTDGTTPNETSAFLTLQQRSFLTSGESTFRLEYFDGIGSSDYLAVSPDITASELGLGAFGVDDLSANLRATLTLLQVSETSWQATVTLTNLDTSTVVSTATTAITTDTAFDTSSKYLLLNTNQIQNITDTTIDINAVEVSAIPEASTMNALGALLVLLMLRRRRG